MAKCVLCAAETKAARGNAMLEEGWFFTEFHGPLGNKYGVFCPGHKWAEIDEKNRELAKRAAVVGAVAVPA